MSQARPRRLIAAALVLFVLTLGLSGSATAVSPDIVVSQVYGGGGNSGATLTNDFIELFNRGSTPVDVSAWSVQYASAAGTTWQRTPLSGTIQPGRYYLVQEAQGAGGSVPLPTSDATGSIAMSATSGKVALVTSQAALACGADCDSNAAVRDFVGYGAANDFEGAGPTPGTSNTTAVLRAGAGCTDTDANNADFAAGAPAPRNSASSATSCVGDTAPAVSTTSPEDGAAGVAVNANVSITFNEAVNVTGTWFSISCGTSGVHTAAVSGGPTTFTLNPDTDFVMSESCTVAIDDTGVSDQDTADPPDTMAADHVFSFATELPLTQIAQVQGATHVSPLAGTAVRVEGVVIAERLSNVWLQDPTPDGNLATSEGILVFGSAVANAVAVGDLVHVTGTVIEFRPGCPPGCDPATPAFDNLSITEIGSPGLGVTNLGPAAAPAATVIGIGGRRPPRLVIDNDATGSVETSGVFDPAQDGIDFYESLESMLVRVNDAVTVGPTSNFREIWVVGDNGLNAIQRTSRGGVRVRDVDPDTLGDYRNGDFNPERIQLDDVMASTPDVHVGDRFPAAIVGVLSYDFANFEVLPLTSPVAVSGGLQRETTEAPGPDELSVATFNVENLDPADAPTIPRLARIIVQNLRSPDLIGIEEMQDDNGAVNDGTTAANLSWQALIDAIAAGGGPTYDFRQIDPQDNADGGQPGGNIRVGFLFRTDRGLAFVDRPGGDATTPTGVSSQNGRAHLTLSPGRVDPGNAAWTATRKPLAGEFTWRGQTFFAIVNHFSSKGGDDPLFGRHQPPVRSTEIARHQQAASVNDFVRQILAVERRANVIVLGDINDFEFSETTSILAGDELTSLMRRLPPPERYSYVFEGNSQVLDQILASQGALRRLRGYDVVHVNAEFFDQASDHEPSVAHFDLGGD